jgi:hypothetical protein
VKPRQTPLVVGWREWVTLPELGGCVVKAKIDTGARTSAIHAFDIDEFERDGRWWASFELHPVQRRRTPAVRAEAPVVEHRRIRSSNGTTEDRPVVRTPVVLGGRRVEIDLTLTNRDEMGFRMLLGRSALRKRFLVDPAKSYLLGRRSEPPADSDASG